MRDFIVGRPESDYQYEFVVIVPMDNGQCKWIGDYEDADPAYEKAQEVDGAVVHNVRIAHKELVKKE